MLEMNRKWGFIVIVFKENESSMALSPSLSCRSCQIDRGSVIDLACMGRQLVLQSRYTAS
jgi:hypothetical protein